MQRKRYDSEVGEGARIWSRVELALARRLPMEHAVAAHRYGKPILVQPRLGQGAFRLLMTDAYQRRCAVTGERTLPVLDAAISSITERYRRTISVDASRTIV